MVIAGTEYEVQAPFYCGLCSKQLNTCNIEAHCASKVHQGKLHSNKDDDWEDAASSAAPQSLPLASAPAASQFRAAGCLIPQESAPQMQPPATRPPPMTMQPFVPQLPGQAPDQQMQAEAIEQQFQLYQQRQLNVPALPLPPSSRPTQQPSGSGCPARGHPSYRFAWPGLPPLAVAAGQHRARATAIAPGHSDPATPSQALRLARAAAQPPASCAQKTAPRDRPRRHHRQPFGRRL